MYVYIYSVCVSVCVCACIYIYIYIEREREREGGRDEERYNLSILYICIYTLIIHCSCVQYSCNEL